MPTPRQTAITLLTIATKSDEWGSAVGEVVDATLQQDFLEAGDLMRAIDHLTGVMVELAGLGALVAKNLAETIDVPVDRVLAAIGASGDGAQ